MRKTHLLLVTAAVIAALSISPVLSAQETPESRRETRAQSSATASETSRARAGVKPEPLEVREGTKINTQLQSRLDARTAKAGDQVTARVTKDVKQNGRTVIHKGDRLVGTVKEVHAGATANAGSQMVVDFDRLAHGESMTELHTTLKSVLSSPSEQLAGGPDMEEPLMAPGPASMGGGGGRPSGGGLVGGIAGGVTGGMNSSLDTATSATGGLAGGTVGAAAQTATRGNTALGLATPVHEIRVGSMASAENRTTGSSVLSTRSGDLRMDSGTSLQFQVSGQANSSARAR